MNRWVLGYRQQPTQVRKPARLSLPLQPGTPEMGTRQCRGWEELPGARGWVLTVTHGSLMVPGQSAPSLGLHLTAVPGRAGGGAERGGGSPILPRGPKHRGTAKARCEADRGVHNRDDDEDTLSFIKLPGCSRHCLFLSH